ncbi:hypothetical protein [Synechococcus sp. PCC 7336]|uniref:hypothetical protein n=1 Tax=Synechococcus sp. PCC 7336 TaxID=195250 RepID=UPI0003498564|nr:hypothetical protein [Synechococcus sp. PCC 7336]
MPPAPDLQAPAQSYVRSATSRLRRQAIYRRHCIARYARLRTHIKGPPAAIAFGPQLALGTQPICRSCRYYANKPQLVCALHPSGPGDRLCSDWQRSSTSREQAANEST